jgi:hypothetical protein
MRNTAAFVIVLALVACSPSAPLAPAAAPVATTTTEATPPPAAPGQGISFQSPTGNIGCEYTPHGGTAVYSTPDGAAELKCDRVEPSYIRITLPEHGAASVMTQVGDAGCCGGETVAYGDEWSAGPFSCDVTDAGLTCTSHDGHGFTLSRVQAQTH